MILINLSAVFDMIAHETLLTLLSELIGIDGIILDWFRGSDHTCQDIHKVL